jgi:DNA-binding SARP family transcriptional activator
MEKLIERHGDLYRVEAGVFDVDLWRCQTALAEARASPDDESARSALARAAAEYGGDLLEGSLCKWAEPIRESLRRQVLDALARLSELQTREGKLDQALAVLEQAIKVDPYAEELYRRGMRPLAQLGRGDATRRLLRQLEARLSQLDAESEEETVQLAKDIGL